ncbi:glycoside hydrolase family 16 protein [Thalassotalea maritima]|uniref:glycoside hydrolase family 16 protein n=1 Tax=Thalassotalea maritima TaxID=3242416 RepID=UPI00352989B0
MRNMILATLSLTAFGCADNYLASEQSLSGHQQDVSAMAMATEATPTNSKWQLIWQDEFSADSIDSTKWSFEQNCFGGGNSERQCYTNRSENAFIDDGVLVIKAIKEDFTGPAKGDDDPSYDISDTRTQPYTSARLRSKDKGDWRYGRFEIRAKLPQGQGSWPAIWMLPTDWAYGSWPLSGEIDIMEAVNLYAKSDADTPPANGLENRIHGTLHYGEKWPNNTYTGTGFTLPTGVNPADGFHVYAVEWEQGEIRWYMDGIHYATQRAENWFSGAVDAKANKYAPFDQRFHMILNLAVGGAWPEAVNEKGVDDSVFPQTMQVDYVRVYQCPINKETGLGCATIGEQALLVK